MGKIRVDEIVNALDNGAPEFPNGVTVSPSTDSFYETSTVILTNSGASNFSGELRFTRIGNMGFIASVGILTHDSGSSVVSGAIIPANMIPNEAVWNVYVSNNNLVGNVIPLTNGTLAINYYSPSTGAAINRSNSGFKIDTAYMIL